MGLSRLICMTTGHVPELIEGKHSLLSYPCGKGKIKKIKGAPAIKRREILVCQRCGNLFTAITYHPDWAKRDTSIEHDR